MLALTGTRVSEATALKWEDIGDDVIHVRRAHWKGIVGTTKTGTTRTVPLPDELATVLKEYRRRLVHEQALGLDEGWVFPSAKGTLVRGSSLQKPLERTLTTAGVEDHFTVHGFRRTLNNLMRQVATGEVVRSITGHVTERMTEHYSHVEDTLALGHVETVKLPARSPNLNAYAERFVRSIKEECLGRMVLLGERHLRITVQQYMEHYHLERNHQGLDNELIAGPALVVESGPVARRQRLGGMLNHYYREGA